MTFIQKNKSPKLSSALIVKESKFGRELIESSFGILGVKTNAVRGNANHVIIFTSGTTMTTKNLQFNQNNFLHLCAYFTARKSIKGNWINHKDEYIAPKVS